MYTIDQLCSEFGISRHTVYGYRKAGILPPPKGGRRYAYWTDQHFRIIRAVRASVHDGRVTLADMAERLHGSADDE